MLTFQASLQKTIWCLSLYRSSRHFRSKTPLFVSKACYFKGLLKTPLEYFFQGNCSETKHEKSLKTAKGLTNENSEFVILYSLQLSLQYGDQGELLEIVPTAVHWSINYSGQILVSHLVLSITLWPEWFITIQKLKLSMLAAQARNKIQARCKELSMNFSVSQSRGWALPARVVPAGRFCVLVLFPGNVADQVQIPSATEGIFLKAFHL